MKQGLCPFAPARSGERYVRKHWYEVRLSTGAVATLYFERQARAKTQTKRRWWLFSTRDVPAPL